MATRSQPLYAWTGLRLYFPGNCGRSVKQPYVHGFLHLLRGLLNILLTSNLTLPPSSLYFTHVLLQTWETNLRAVVHTWPLLLTHHLYAGGSGGYIPTTSPYALKMVECSLNAAGFYHHCAITYTNLHGGTYSLRKFSNTSPIIFQNFWALFRPC